MNKLKQSVKYPSIKALLQAIRNSLGKVGKLPPELGINAQEFPFYIEHLNTGSGNAQPGDVLKGKTFTNDNGIQTGTLVLPSGVEIKTFTFDFKNTVLKSNKKMIIVGFELIGQAYEFFYDGGMKITGNKASNPLLECNYVHLSNGMYINYITPGIKNNKQITHLFYTDYEDGYGGNVDVTLHEYEPSTTLTFTWVKPILNKGVKIYFIEVD